MKGNEFETLYKTWTTDKLLDVLDNPMKYQPQAVEAARHEIDRRQLTEQQLTEARADQSLRRLKTAQEEKGNGIESKIRSVGSSVVDTLNPIQTDVPATEKLIKLISVSIGGLFFYKIYKEFYLLTSLLTDNGGRWDFSVVMYGLPFILLPTAGLLLWFRKKLGWVLATIYFSYSAAAAMAMFLAELTRESTGMPGVDTLFPTVSPTFYIGTFLVFAGLTWTLCKEKVREVYRIDKQMMLMALGIGTGIILLIAI
jgi:hypothetical protein